MLLPSIPISSLYAYNTKFYNYTLDATLVIAITYFGTTPGGDRAALAAAARSTRPRRSPSTSIAGIPLVTISGLDLRRLPGVLRVQVVLRRRLLRQQLRLELYMLALYVVALVIYVISRIVRRREGIDLGMVNSQIPVE